MAPTGNEPAWFYINSDSSEPESPGTPTGRGTADFSHCSAVRRRQTGNVFPPKKERGTPRRQRPRSFSCLPTDEPSPRKKTKFTRFYQRTAPGRRIPLSPDKMPVSLFLHRGQDGGILRTGGRNRAERGSAALACARMMPKGRTQPGSAACRPARTLPRRFCSAVPDAPCVP